MQSLVPSWPLYVVSEILYKGYSKYSDPRTAKNFLQEFAKENGYNDANEMQWNLENVTITKDIFDKRTLYMMNKRKMGKDNPFQVPNDSERHAGAKERQEKNPNIKQRGFSGPAVNEPILLIRWQNGKYELWEGWHRTLQAMLSNPQGYQQKAYVVQSRKWPIKAKPGINVP